MRTVFETTITFTEPVLGTMCGNPDVHAEHVSSKIAKDRGDDIDPDERAGRKAEEDAVARQSAEAVAKQDGLTLDEQMARAMTIFPKDEQGLFIWDYQIRGYYKESLKALIEAGSVDSCSIWTVARGVDNFVYVRPRKVYLLKPDGSIWQEAPDILTRPLRAQTMRGERIALASSKELPAGTKIKFKTEILETMPKVKAPKPDDIMRALDFGAYKGIGQWRGGGYGRFEHVTEIIETPPPRKKKEAAE